MCFDGFYLKWFNLIADKRATNLTTQNYYENQCITNSTERSSVDGFRIVAYCVFKSKADV